MIYAEKTTEVKKPREEVAEERSQKQRLVRGSLNGVCEN